MKKIILVFTFLCFIYTACNTNTNTTKKISYQDSLKQLLIGDWGSPEAGDPVFRITNDSIYYLQNHQAYSYKLDSNNVFINHPTDKWEFKNISFKKDTFIFHDPNDEKANVWAIRFKNTK